MTYVSTCLADGALFLLPLGESNSGQPAVDLAAHQNGAYHVEGSAITFGAAGPVGSPYTGATFVEEAHPASGVYIPANAALTIADVFTYECWLRLTGTPASNLGGLVARCDAQFPFLAIYYDVGSADIGKLYASTLLSSIALSTNPVPVGGLHHCVWTHNGATDLLYVDAVEGTAPDTPATVVSSTGPYSVGALYNLGGGSTMWDAVGGEVTLAAIYPTALTAGQISNHFTLGNTPLSSPNVPGPATLGGRFHF